MPKTLLFPRFGDGSVGTTCRLSGTDRRLLEPLGLTHESSLSHIKSIILAVHITIKLHMSDFNLQKGTYWPVGIPFKLKKLRPLNPQIRQSYHPPDSKKIFPMTKKATTRTKRIYEMTGGQAGPPKGPPCKEQ